MTYPVPVKRAAIIYMTPQTTSIILQRKRYHLRLLLNLSYSDVHVTMEHHGLLDFLLQKHHLRIRKLSDDAVTDLNTELYNETR